MPTNQCTDVNQLIPTYLDGELAESELHSFEHHLADCGACASEVDEERAFITRVRSALATPPAPDTLRARLQRTLDAEEREDLKHSRRKLGAWILPGVATVAAAAALVVFTLDIAQPAQNQNASAVRTNLASATPVSAGSVEIPRSASEFLQMPVRAPNFHNAEASLRSWKPIRNRSHDAALLVFDVRVGKKTYAIEVMTLDARNLDFSQAERRVVRGTPVWVASVPGVNSVSFKDADGVGYIVTSRLDLDELLDQLRFR